MLTFPFDTLPAPGNSHTVAPGVLWLRMPLPFVLDHINLWLLEEQDGYTLIDSGYGDPSTRELWMRHFETTLRDRPLVRIIVSHYHPDHIGNADWLMRRFGCPLYMSSSEFLMAHAVAANCVPFSVEAATDFFRAHGMAQEYLDAYLARRNYYRTGAPSLPPCYRRLQDGDAIRLGDDECRVITGYGHAPEHLSFHAPAAKLLISGDMLLPKISTNVAVWPVQPDADPLAHFLASLDACSALPDDTLVLPAHGLPFRGIAERVAQLHQHHRLRLDEVKTALREEPRPLSAADIVPVLFRRKLDLHQRFFAIGEAIAHLNHLWHHDEIVRDVDAKGSIRFALTK